jgi:hypothetical protein
MATRLHTLLSQPVTITAIATTVTTAMAANPTKTTIKRYCATIK